MMVLIQCCTWVFPLYYSDWRLVEMVIELVWVEVGWMVAGVVVVGLVEVQVVMTENMNFVDDSVGTVDKEKVDMVVDKAVGMDVGMDDFLEHTLANLEEVGFGSTEEAKFSKAWVHSMNFEWEFENYEEIVEEQNFETYL
jgi:hypothetical protein